MRGVKWTKEEDNYLLENYTKIDINVISSYLNKTPLAIKQRGRKLGFNLSRTFYLNPGDKYGRLTALEFSHKIDYRKYWKFQCDCGRYHTTDSTDVIAGRVISCGCYSKERSSEKFYKGYGVSATKDLYSTYRRQAANRNIAFNLSEQEFGRIILGNCFICGVAPLTVYRKTEKSIHGDEFKYNGVDRYDNTKGYSLENCRSCCKICNIAKNDLTVEQFESWLKRLLEYNNAKA